MSLRHPRIVTVFGVSRLESTIYLVRELTTLGSLPDVLYGGTIRLSKQARARRSRRARCGAARQPRA